MRPAAWKPETPAINKTRAADMLAKFDGTGKYAVDPNGEYTNPCFMDAGYARQIEREFGMTLSEVRKALQQ